jgi:hypothetical protein
MNQQSHDLQHLFHCLIIHHLFRCLMIQQSHYLFHLFLHALLLFYASRLNISYVLQLIFHFSSFHVFYSFSYPMPLFSFSYYTISICSVIPSSYHCNINNKIEYITSKTILCCNTKKILERGSGVDRKFDFLNRCSDGQSETADAKISSKHNRFDIHMLDSEVGWITCE